MEKCKICGLVGRHAFFKHFNRNAREDMNPLPDLNVEDEWEFVECPWCHALQTHALDHLSWEEMRQFYQYEESYVPKSKNRANRAVRFLARALKMFPQPEQNKSLLSYGTGISPEPEMFRELGWTVDTCDFGAGYTFTPQEFAEIDKKYHVITSMEVK